MYKRIGPMAILSALSTLGGMAMETVTRPYHLMTLGNKSKNHRGRGKTYDTVRPEVRNAWACKVGDVESRKAALNG